MSNTIDDPDVAECHRIGLSPSKNHTLLDFLPEVVWGNVALHLSARDVLSLLSVNRRLCSALGESGSFWDMLSNRDGASCYAYYHRMKELQTPRAADDKVDGCYWRRAKHSFLFHCHKANPTKSFGGVRWYPVRPYGRFSGISDREGHVACVVSRKVISNQVVDGLSMSSSEEGQLARIRERFVVITGGFSDDDSVYIINAGTGILEDNPRNSERRLHRWSVKRLEPRSGSSFVYGATLTALPTEYSMTTNGECQPRLTVRMRAIRFGGFRAGGYSGETSQVSMLTLTQEAHARRRHRRGKREREPKHDNEGDESEEHAIDMEWQWDQQFKCDWSNISTTGVISGDHDVEGSPERYFLSRAYHSSTLLLDRYLVVLGGMKSDCSILNEAILDTKTWTWIGEGRISLGADGIDSRPSGRHGHSVVLDDTRNRLVLFGGGSGSDLLRSGDDNSEVWELQLGDKWQGDHFAASFPWKWKKLHNDSNRRYGNSESEHNIGHDTENAERLLTLSPSETLCLGRCHHGIKISRDTVLLFFGSGRPSTNGVIAYDLKADVFFRHDQVSQPLSSSTTSGGVCIKGIIPKPRFTGVAAFLNEDGYILTHGGYCSQDHDTIGTMDVLDLAPAFRGQPLSSSSFDGLPIDHQRVSYANVTNSQADRWRQDPDAALQRMLQTLDSTPLAERRAAAGNLLNQMHRGDLPSNRQTMLLMSMIALGRANFESDDEYNSDIS